MPVGELEMLAHIIVMLAGLASLAWGWLGWRLNISRVSAINFSLANIMLLAGNLAALSLRSDRSVVEFYQSFNLADVMFLGAAVLFRVGLRGLYDLPPPGVRDYAVIGVVAIVAFGIYMLGMPNVAGVLVLLATSMVVMQVLYDTDQKMRARSGTTRRLLLLWPIAAAAGLLLWRAFDDVQAIFNAHGDMSATFRGKYFHLYLWLALLITMVINATLIGLTINMLVRKLHAQNNSLQNILDTAPVGVAVSIDGIVRFANPRVTELLDMKVGDPSAQSLVLPEDRDRIDKEMLAQGMIRNMELQMYCPHRTVRDLLVTYLPTDFAGQPGILAWLVDITDQKKANRDIRQTNDEQTAIFESATLGIAFIKDKIITRANHKLEQLFGWEAGQMLGLSPAIWSNQGGAAEDGPYQDLLRGEIHHSTQRLTRKDGSSFWCRLGGSAIDSKDLSRGSVWLFDDVSQEREAAELMRKAKDMAEDATRMKSDFLANMSHEIRTPMNAIIGMTHLALKTELNSKQRNYISKVDAAARNLMVIINDILDFSKIEAGKLQFEMRDFRLEDVLDNLADLTVIKAQEKGLELLFDVAADVPTSLVGDDLRLGQVLLNLVGNAIKFTDQGEITVRIQLQEAQEQNFSDQVVLCFEIIDTGVGLSQEQCARLFDAFSQADASTTRKYGGTGLGLTISRRLVELMKGQIGVSSQLGAGSCFYFTASFGRYAQQKVLPTAVHDSHDLRVLLVDDNARAREILLAILKSQHFSATAVSSGRAAIEELNYAEEQSQPYGLVLMDWLMPERDGLFTLREMRAIPVLAKIPVFMMATAHSIDALLEEAGETRIDGILQKPINPSSLIDAILMSLGKEILNPGRRQQRHAASNEAEEKMQGAYLLLVEDNSVNQELATELLQNAGIKVDIANNGLEAISMIEIHDYDGVLMDCQMPVMDGFSATRQIRGMQRFAKLPIIAMTANAMSGDKELCLDAGMNDHIAKPIDVNQLFITLARWVTQKVSVPDVGSSASQEVLGPDIKLPVIAGLNLDSALQRLGGNHALLLKLIQRFADNQRGTIINIRQALMRDDLSEAILATHTIKGLAGNIGASQIQSLAAELETALRNDQTDSLTVILPSFEQELAIQLKHIELALPENIAGTIPKVAIAETVDMAALAIQLQQLAELLADDDARADKLATHILGELRQLDLANQANQISKHISKYEFEEALEKLKEAAQLLGIGLRE